MRSLPIWFLAILSPACALNGCCPQTPTPASQSPPKPASPSPTAAEDFAGSKNCRDCHEDFYKLWVTSHHGLAMQPYTPRLAKDKFTPAREPVAIGNRKYRPEVGDGEGAVCETGPAGTKRYPIAHVMGGKNVYYFLTPLQRGRLQVLPVAYDVQKKAWYDTAASGVRHFPDRRDEALDWTDRMYTFNTTCFNCHVSQLATNYDLDSDTYRTTWAEAGISCESCHGPAQAHVRAMMAEANGGTSAEIKILRAKDFSAEQMNDMCATCHAKMVPLSVTFKPGEKFFDHFDLITLEHPDFYPDGRDLGENYTHTSWMMSPCAKSGKLDCNHCHTPSGRMRFEGKDVNQSCVPCHQREVSHAPEHGHHQVGSKGNECIGCHMPMTRFAAMGRSDHSMRPPTPATTIAMKSPNACNLCHQDQDASWADTWARKWYGEDYQAHTMHQAQLIDAARKGQWQRLPEMLAELARPGADAVHKTSLVRLLRGCADERKWPPMLEATKDPSPLVRSSAVSALSDRLTPDAIAGLLHATRDTSRLVRIRAAMALASLSPDRLQDDRDQASLKRAIDEFKVAMHARPDDWASYANLGNFHMQRGEFPDAVAYFETAYKLEPRSIGPMVNAAICYSNLRRTDDAESSLRRALQIEPDNAAANFNLGLLMAERQRPNEAETALNKALKADPQMAPAAYNLGVLLGDKDAKAAIHWCQKAHQLQPDEPKYAHTLAFYYRRAGDTKRAIELLTQVLDRRPDYLDAHLLLGEIHESAGDQKAAAAVYRRALEHAAVPPSLRTQLQAKLSAIDSKTGP